LRQHKLSQKLFRNQKSEIQKPFQKSRSLPRSPFQKLFQKLSEIRNQESEIKDPEARSRNPEACPEASSRSCSRNQKSEIRNQRSRSPFQKSRSLSRSPFQKLFQKLFRSQKSEIRNPEARSRNPEAVSEDTSSRFGRPCGMPTIAVVSFFYTRHRRSFGQSQRAYVTRSVSKPITPPVSVGQSSYVTMLPRSWAASKKKILFKKNGLSVYLL